MRRTSLDIGPEPLPWTLGAVSNVKIVEDDAAGRIAGCGAASTGPDNWKVKVKALTSIVEGLLQTQGFPIWTVRDCVRDVLNFTSKIFCESPGVLGTQTGVGGSMELHPGNRIEKKAATGAHFPN